MSRATAFKPLGSSNHSISERVENDYYSTDPKALELLLKREPFSNKIWECAVGGGHLAQVLTSEGFDVVVSDIIDRGYPGTKIINFIKPDSNQIKLYKSFIDDRDIITNPPYSALKEFIESGLLNLQYGHKMAIFVRIQALEGKARRLIYNKYPIYKVYIPSQRIRCYPNGVKTTDGSALCFVWIIWKKGYSGPTTVEWLD